MFLFTANICRNANFRSQSVVVVMSGQPEVTHEITMSGDESITEETRRTRLRLFRQRKSHSDPSRPVTPPATDEAKTKLQLLHDRLTASSGADTVDISHSPNVNKNGTTPINYRSLHPGPSPMNLSPIPEIREMHSTGTTTLGLDEEEDEARRHQGLSLLRQLENADRSAIVGQANEEKALLALRLHQSIVRRMLDLQRRLEETSKRCAKAERELRCERKVVSELDRHNSEKEKWCAQDVLHLQQQLELEQERTAREVAAANERRMREVDLLEKSHRTEIAAYEARIAQLEQLTETKEKSLSRAREEHLKLKEELKGTELQVAELKIASERKKVRPQAVQVDSPDRSPPPLAPKAETTPQRQILTADPSDFDEDMYATTSVAPSTFSTVNHPARRGYLYHAEESRGCAWVRRFFLFTKGRLLCAESDDQRLKFLLHLSQVVKIKATSSKSQTQGHGKGLPKAKICYCFCIEYRPSLKSPLQTLEFGSADKIERDAWMAALRAPKIGSPGSSRSPSAGKGMDTRSVGGGTVVSTHGGLSSANSVHSEWRRQNEERRAMASRVHALEEEVRKSLSPN